jgi:hypothetical protein
MALKLVTFIKHLEFKIIKKKKEMVFSISLISFTTSTLMNIPLLHRIATAEAYVLQKEKDGTFYGLGDCSMLVNSLSTPMSGQKIKIKIK